VGEFRALWVAQLGSVVGDQLARVALTVLVYAKTGSAFLAAVTFVASVIPVFLGGITLAGLADRFPRRSVMIVCDVLRCLLVLVMALSGMPVAVLVALLFLVTLIGAPFSAARAALYPDVLPGERYVTGQAVTLTTSQFAQVLGFAVGGAVAGFLGTRVSLVADAATFALSAVIVRAWVRQRPAPAREAKPGERGSRQGAFGIRGAFTGAARLVLGTPALRLPMFFGWLAAFYNVPEGVAAPLARSLSGGSAAVGIILAAQVFGESAGMLVFGRLVPPAARARWSGPLAIAACAVLVLFAFPLPLGAALPVLAASGAFGAYQLAASAAFVRAVPPQARSAAFGLAQGGMSLGQGVVMIAAGAAAGTFTPTAVITVTGAAGAVCATAVAIAWARAAKE
jgi:predicted MFS family arabinose efflux permease